ncbi:thermonuclease family protein [Laribacter hongkongensis]|uniref:thermonuclease family protein n=1 Tax=Laribacter hongkongensis TaxID=168471 RepID=UPI001EFC8170|nr:thermonuclease family protein [Laribacter hongkongensis]MCG9079170.1 thermonuclease family protein [Laribacter hongkongensis]
MKVLVLFVPCAREILAEMTCSQHDFCMKSSATLFASLLTLCAAASASEIQCKVVAVADGDTVTCLADGHRQIKVRLAQIDAPEKDQQFGQRSKQSLSDLVYGKTVTLNEDTTDRYGRIVGTLIVNGKDANLIQVQTGMAWVYKQYARDPAYFRAENEARAARRGLWTDPAPIPPQDWRRGKKGEGSQARATPADSAASIGSKTTCRQMTSCDEAKRYLAAGLTKLDRDGDGMPCELICK